MNALIWLLIGWLLGRGGKDLTTWGPPTEKPPETPPTGWPSTKPPVTTPPQPQTLPTTTPPWPQSVPPGLPPFPSGWEPDEPVGSGVAARAFALLPELWTYGAGTRKTEQTAGRWITYVAVQMGSKRGVVAYRLKAGAVPASAVPSAPAGTVPASASYATAAPATSLRTLRRGSSGGDVEALQRLLGIAADGKFGPGTESAVKAFQNSRGLVADGIVGPKTWSALTGR